MFAKLVKQEFLSSYRRFLPIYGAIIGLSLLSSFTIHLEELTDISIMITGYLFLLIGITAIFTLYTIVINLGQRVFGKPGYLLFTTPASTVEIIASKTLVNLFWLLLGVFVSVLAVASLFMFRYGSVLETIFHWFTDIVYNNLYEFIVICFLGVVYSFFWIGMLFFLFAFLNMVYKGEKKVLIGIIFYFIISEVAQIIPRIVLGATYGILSTLNDINYAWVMIATYGVVAIAFYLLTYFILEKKLEIQ